MFYVSSYETRTLCIIDIWINDLEKDGPQPQFRYMYIQQYTFRQVTLIYYNFILFKEYILFMATNAHAKKHVPTSSYIIYLSKNPDNRSIKL